MNQDDQAVAALAGLRSVQGAHARTAREKLTNAIAFGNTSQLIAATITAEHLIARKAPPTTREPVGPKPLWGHAGWHLPPYIEHVANDLIESGHPESQAVEMAVGIVENWAEGHDGRGGKVHPDTQAAAAAAIAEWEKLKAQAAASHVAKKR